MTLGEWQVGRSQIGQDISGRPERGKNRYWSLTELACVVDWATMRRRWPISTLRPKATPRPPLALFKAMLIAVWYDLSDKAQLGTPPHAMEGIGQGHPAGAPHRDRLQPETNRHHRTAGEGLKNSVLPAAECRTSHSSTRLRSALRSASTRPIAGERQKRSRAQVSLSLRLLQPPGCIKPVPFLTRL